VGSLKRRTSWFLGIKYQVEHTEMVCSLVGAGISSIEAEQIITIRKNTINKACREWKKLSKMNATSKKSDKTSKAAVTKTYCNGN
jgi:hypothetical protein